MKVGILVLALLLCQTSAEISNSTYFKRAGDDEDLCDLDCFMSNLKIYIDLNYNFSFLWYDYNFPYIEIHDITLDNIKGYVDNEDAPKAFTIELRLKKAIADGPVMSKGKNDGSIYVQLQDVFLKMTMSFETVKYNGYNLINASNPIIDLDLNLDHATIKLTIDDAIVDSFIDAFINVFKGFLDRIVKNQLTKLQGLLKEELDKLFSAINNNFVIKYVGQDQPQHIEIEDGMTNITESSIFDMVSWVTSSMLGGNSSLGLNSIIDRFTNGTGSLLIGTEHDTFQKFSKQLIEKMTFNGINITNLNATLDFGLKFVNISYLDTVTELDFFDPVRKTEPEVCNSDPNCDYQMTVASGLEKLFIKFRFSINATANGSVITTQGKKLNEEANFIVETADNHMRGRVQVAIPDGVIENYSNKQCKNATCLKALIDKGTGVSFISLNTTIKQIKMTASSHSLEDGVQEVINSMASVFIYNYYDVIPSFLNGLLNEEGTTAINNLLNDTLGTTCDDDPDEILLSYEPGVVVYSFTVSIILSFILCAIAIVFFVSSIRKRHQSTKVDDDHISILESADKPDNDDVAKEDNKEEKDENSDNDSTEEKTPKLTWKQYPKWFVMQFLRTDKDGASMFLDSRINIFIRVIIPFSLLCGICIFLISNTGTGATVDAYIDLGNGQILKFPVQDFGLMNSVKEMWDAKVYPLAILIMAFSGIWPYAKIVMMLYTWFMPSSILKPQSREKYLKALDALGKWSLVDSYVMVLMIVAFFFDVPLPIKHPDTVKQPFKVNLYVYPALGFTLLILGTLFSLLMSHIMVFIHYYIMRKPTDNTGEEATKWRPLMFYTKYITVRILIIVLNLASFALIIGGMIETSFSFDFLGLAGWALEQLGFSQHREFSLLDLGMDIPSATREPNSFAVRMTQTIYFATIIAIPIIHMICMLIMWLVPMTRLLQSIMYNVCSVLYAWSAIDVFLVSVMAAIIELEQFAEFMVEPYCSAKIGNSDMSIDDIIAQFFGSEEYIRNGNETCFKVVAVLEKGCWLTLGSVVLYTITSILVMKISKKALIKRLPSKQDIEYEKRLLH